MVPRCAVALLLLLGRAPASDEIGAMPEDDACLAGEGDCALALRQLRGEQVFAGVHGHAPEDPQERIGVEAMDGNLVFGDAVPAPADGPTAGGARSVARLIAEEPVNASATAAAAEQTGPTLGPFCCQNGQGLGYTDEEDMGASCFPSAKPEVDSFCDDKSMCASKCNGTWVPGFCVLEAAEGKDACATKLNTRGTGYMYTGSKTRAVGHGHHCSTEEACGGLGCNGTWCLYVKDAIY